MPDNNNLVLWESVAETDRQFTKPGKKGAYEFTAISPVYQFKNATRAFGIQGIGWGVKIGSEIFSFEEYGETMLITYDAIMFFKYDGEIGEIPIHAQEKMAYRTMGVNGYMKVDDEARKKVVTNAKTKGLSELGFNADIFMGMFEDPEYLEQLDAKLRLENAADVEAEKEQMYGEFNEWLKNQCDTILIIPNSAAVKLVIDKHERTLRDMLKVLQASPQKLEQSIKRLFAAGDMANQLIETKKNKEV